MLENKQQPRLEHSLLFETLSLWSNKLYFSDNYTLISFAGNESEMHRSILEHTIRCLVKGAGDHWHSAALPSQTAAHSTCKPGLSKFSKTSQTQCLLRETVLPSRKSEPRRYSGWDSTEE